MMSHAGDTGQRLWRLALRGFLPMMFGGRGVRGLKGRLYLNVGHTGLDRPGHTQWIARTGVRPIYFVHDLIPLTHPEF
ncbi:MAG: hypothetical protein J0G94_18675, partial [Sphingomonadales bacterium]|nr:hypothetical protein [Sphingomonadales bacterium]